MYIVYILKSELHDRYYIGHSNDVKKRFERHNKGYVKSTKPFRPWKIIYTEEYSSKSDAYRREMEIKSYKHGEAFKKLINI